MEQRLTAAVIGCGRMGAFTNDLITRYAPSCWLPLSHAEAISIHPRLRLTALSDVDAEALARAADKYRVLRRYSDSRALLDTERPPLLGIATRTVGRADLISHAAGVGTRAIHAEKPLCNSVAELQALRALFERNDFFVTWGAIRRYFDIFREARALADSGRYGPLREMRVKLGSAPLFWTHPHSIDLLLFGAGERRLAGVQARLADVSSEGASTTVVSDPRVISASLYFEDGVAGHITQALGSDFILSCADAEISVRNDGMSIEINAVRSGIYPETLVHEHTPGAGPQGSFAPVSMLVGCLEGDTGSIAANTVIKRDILAGQQAAFAMLQSHLEGSRIVDPLATDPAMVIYARTGGRHA